MNAGSATYTLQAIMSMKDRMSGAVERAKKKILSLSNEISKSDNRLRRFNRGMSQMKWGGVMLGSATAIAGAFMATRYETSKLEAELRGLDIDPKAVDMLSDSAGKMAGKFGISKDTLLTGMYDIKSAVSSLNAEGMESFADAIATTARATKGDFAQLSKTFGMVYNQFGKKSGMDAGAFASKTADTFSMAVKKFRTDGVALDQAFNSAGASAAKLGISLGEQTAVLGNLMNTMTAGESGTAWKSFTSKISGGFKKLGLDTKDAHGKMLNTADLMEQLESKFGASIDTDELSALISSFGEEGAKMVLSLYGNSGALRQQIDQMENAHGTATEMMLANMNSLAGATDKLKFGFGAVWNSISKSAEGNIVPIINWLNGLVQWYNKLTAEKKENINTAIRWGLIGLSMFGVILVIGGAINALSAMIRTNIILQKISAFGVWLWKVITGKAALGTGAFAKAFKTLNTIMKANPIIRIITIVIAAIAVIYSFRHEIMEFTQVLWENELAMNAVVGVLGVMMGPIGWIGAAVYYVSRYWDSLSSSLTSAYNAMAKWLGLPLISISKTMEKNTQAVKNTTGAVEKLNKEREKAAKIEEASLNLDFLGTGSEELNINKMPEMKNFSGKYIQNQAPTTMKKTINMYFKNLAGNINITGNSRRESREMGNFLLRSLDSYVEMEGT